MDLALGSQANRGKNHTAFLTYTMSTPLPLREGTLRRRLWQNDWGWG